MMDGGVYNNRGIIFNTYTTNDRGRRGQL